MERSQVKTPDRVGHGSRLKDRKDVVEMPTKKPIPKSVAQLYGSARAFRQTKRRALRQLIKALDELRLGCAHYPNGARAVEAINYEATLLQQELSVENWGR